MSFFRRAVLLVLACAGFTATATDYRIFGTVTDDSSEPEAYATIRIFSESDTIHAASLGVTGEDGTFSQTVKSPGVYILHVASVGKTPFRGNVQLTAAQPTYDFGTIQLGINTELLREVEVVATRPLVEKEIDRIGYDVQADDDSKTATVQDILRKVPMVTVDADGTIKVRGSSNFKIYRNGRPSNSFTNNAKDIFAAIPASMIKKIEVITDPGAKEDAEGVGAILNIVTLENTSIDGVMGNVRIGTMTNNGVPAGGVWLTGNIGKFTLSVNGGYFYQSESMSRNSSVSDYTYTDTGNRMISRNSNSGHGNIGFWGVDGSYELDSLNLFTLEFGGYSYGVKGWNSGLINHFDSDGNLLYSYGSNTYVPKVNYLDFNGNFNYQRLTRRKDESITFSYAISNTNDTNESETEYEEFVDYPADYSGVNSDTRQHFIEHTFQLDWTRPIDSHNKFSIGGKTILRRSHAKNSTEYVGVGDTFDDFIHKTTVGAGYFDYCFNTGKLSARAGLRYEYSRLSADFVDGKQSDFGSSLNDWVPNASVMYNLSEMSTLKASYTTRINRPGITYLDPTKTSTPSSISYGNPDLESSHYNSIALNYSLMKQKIMLDLTASYDFANNTIASIVKTDASDFITFTYGNAGRTRKFNFSVFAQWTLSPKTSLMLNASVDYSHYEIREMSLKNNGWGVNVFARATQQLPWKLRLEGMMFYNTGSLESVYTYCANNSGRSIFHNFSLQRNFLKDDRLTVKLVARNPFSNSIKMRTCTNRGSYVGTDVSYFENSKEFGIEIAYRFGSVNAKVKRTAVSINNDDLQGGASAPSSGRSGASMGE